MSVSSRFVSPQLQGCEGARALARRRRILLFEHGGDLALDACPAAIVEADRVSRVLELEEAAVVELGVWRPRAERVREVLGKANDSR